MAHILRKINIPESFEIGGGIEAKECYITFDKHQYTGEIDNAVVHIDICSTIQIQGVDIVFESKISHTLTDQELENLMTILNK